MSKTLLKDWQRHWVGEAIKVKLTDLNFSTLNSMEYESAVLKWIRFH